MIEIQMMISFDHHWRIAKIKRHPYSNAAGLRNAKSLFVVSVLATDGQVAR